MASIVHLYPSSIDIDIYNLSSAISCITEKTTLASANNQYVF